MISIDISELRRLETMLTEAGIKYEWYDVDYLGGAEIKIPSLEAFRNKQGVSVIQFNGSWGGAAGKLECWCNTRKKREKEPIGWLSAEEVFKKVKEALL